MPYELYTDRRDGPRMRTVVEINDTAWCAISALLISKLNDHSFGAAFPLNCDDGGAQFGCDQESFFAALNGIAAFPPLHSRFRGLPRTPWSEPGDADIAPTDAILDGLEWCAGKIGEPKVISTHSYYRHDHLRWDCDAGLMNFVAEVNQIFSRNALAYEMADDGKIRRTVDSPVAVALSRSRFNTGDCETDRLLEQSRIRFFDRNATAGQDALEKLWDAFERIKTLENQDKKAGVTALLNRAAPQQHTRALLEAEMRALTDIGNQWAIRHHETSKHPLGDDRTLRDYFFERMFALLHLLLLRTGRISEHAQS